VSGRAGTGSDRRQGPARAAARCGRGAAGRLGSHHALKPHLGDGFTRLVGCLQAAIDERYALPPWTDESFARHKRADRIAAASEARHVVGWNLRAMRDDLGIVLAPAAPTHCGARADPPGNHGRRRSRHRAFWASCKAS